MVDRLAGLHVILQSLLPQRREIVARAQETLAVSVQNGIIAAL